MEVILHKIAAFFIFNKPGYFTLLFPTFAKKIRKNISYLILLCKIQLK